MIPAVGCSLQVVPELEGARLERVESDAVPSLSRVVMMGEGRPGTLSLAEVAGQGRGMEGALEGIRRGVDRWPVLDME